MTKPLTKEEKTLRAKERETPEVKQPEVHPEVVVASDTKSVVQQLKESIIALQNRRAELDAERDGIDSQMAELREMLGIPEAEHEPEVRRKYTPRQTQEASNGRRGRGSNEKVLEEYVFLALKKAGKKGLSQDACAQLLLDQGFKTPSDFAQFSKSVYVSGINKLTSKGWVSYFKAEGEKKGRYRLTPEAPSVWER